MRVIEQLVQHFWARGALTREEALYLVGHGFVREADLAGLADEPRTPDPEPEPPGDRPDPRTAEAELHDRTQAELEDRTGGGKKGGKKKKPAGHNLAPLVGVLGNYFAEREPYPALHELGSRLRRCPTWRDAAKAVAGAAPAKLEAALVGLLNARPRALGELWFWFDLEALFAWAEHPGNAGPVADAVGKLLRADTPARVGRAEKLKKTAPEMRDLTDLLAARRPFLAQLPGLYDRYFDRLGQWLIPPTWPALDRWPALPWAFVIVYNARNGTPDSPPAGYPVDPRGLSYAAVRAALAAALPIDPVPVRELLIHRIRERHHPLPDVLDWDHNAVFDRPLHCPYTWKV